MWEEVEKDPEDEKRLERESEGCAYGRTGACLNHQLSVTGSRITFL